MSCSGSSRRVRVAAEVTLAVPLAAIAGLAGGAETAAARLDLDAGQQAPLVPSGGRSLRSGIAVRAVAGRLPPTPGDR